MTEITIALTPSYVPPLDEDMLAHLEMRAFARGGLSNDEIATINDVWGSAFARGWKAGTENAVEAIRPPR